MAKKAKKSNMVSEMKSARSNKELTDTKNNRARSQRAISKRTYIESQKAAKKTHREANARVISETVKKQTKGISETGLNRLAKDESFTIPTKYNTKKKKKKAGK